MGFGFLFMLAFLHSWAQQGLETVFCQRPATGTNKQLDALVQDIWNHLSLCSIPSGLRNMDIIRSQGRSGQMVIKAVCHPGFTLEGSSVVSCNHGQWNDSLPHCLPSDCLSHYNMGQRRSGLFLTKPKPGDSKKVFCHMGKFPLEYCHSYYQLGQQSNGFYKMKQKDGSGKDTFCFMSSFADNSALSDCLAYFNAGNKQNGIYRVTQYGSSAEVYCVMSSAYSVSATCKDFYESGQQQEGTYFISQNGKGLSQVFCAMTTVSNPSQSCTAYYKNGYTTDGFYFMKHDEPSEPVSEQYCVMSSFSTPKEDCLAHFTSGYEVNGNYLLKSRNLPQLEVSCDMTSNGGGWTVIQQRQDNSVDFRRTYSNYQMGFGHTWSDSWIGLEALHQLTKKPSEVYIYLEAKDEDSVWALYSNFQVAEAKDGYRLTVSGYNGTAGDAMELHNGQKFSTIDKDQDSNARKNCASTARAGWWHSNCYYANLNGPYLYPKNGIPTISWVQYKGFGQSLRKVHMKVRRNI